MSRSRRYIFLLIFILLNRRCRCSDTVVLHSYFDFRMQSKLIFVHWVEPEFRDAHRAIKSWNKNDKLQPKIVDTSVSLWLFLKIVIFLPSKKDSCRWSSARNAKRKKQDISLWPTESTKIVHWNRRWTLTRRSCGLRTLCHWTARVKEKWRWYAKTSVSRWRK